MPFIYFLWSKNNTTNFFAVSTRMQFFKSVAQALADFNELNPIAPLQLLLEVKNN